MPIHQDKRMRLDFIRHRGFTAFPGSDEENQAILERVNATGEAYLSHTVLNGRYVLRLAVGNMRTTEADVRRAWELLQTA